MLTIIAVRSQGYCFPISSEGRNFVISVSAAAWLETLVDIAERVSLESVKQCVRFVSVEGFFCGQVGMYVLQEAHFR